MPALGRPHRATLPLDGSQRLTIVAVTAAGLFGAVEVLWSTREGVGLWIDSSSYLGAARSLLDGRGLTLPFEGAETFAVSAPLLAVLLALAGAAGGDLLQSIRWLNAGLFATTIVMAGLAVRRLAPHATGVAAATAWLVALAPDLVQIHQFALSEPLFLTLVLGAFVALASHLERRSTRRLVGSALLMAAALLTRYAGLAFVAAGALALLARPARAGARRFAESLTWSAVALLPSARWAWNGAVQGNGASGRSLGWHPVPLWKVGTAARTVRDWILPAAVPLPMFVLVAAAAGGWLAWRALRRGRTSLVPPAGPLAALPLLLLLGAGVYAAFLVTVISVLDFATATNGRILMPGHLLLLIGGMAALAKIRNTSSAGIGSALRRAAVALPLWLLVLSLARLPGALSRQPPLLSLDYTDTGWDTSELVAAIREIPDGVRLLTNAPDAVYLLTGRPSTGLPKRWLPRSNRINEDYDREMAVLRETAAREPVAYVHFSTGPRGYVPSEAGLKAYLSLVTVQALDDGRIYRPVVPVQPLVDAAWAPSP